MDSTVWEIGYSSIQKKLPYEVLISIGPAPHEQFGEFFIPTKRNATSADVEVNSGRSQENELYNTKSVSTILHFQTTNLTTHITRRPVRKRLTQFQFACASHIAPAISFRVLAIASQDMSIDVPKNLRYPTSSSICSKNSSLPCCISTQL